MARDDTGPDEDFGPMADSPELDEDSEPRVVLFDCVPRERVRERCPMRAMVGPFQITKLVKVITGGIQATGSGGVPWSAGRGRIDAMGNSSAYGP